MRLLTFIPFLVLLFTSTWAKAQCQGGFCTPPPAYGDANPPLVTVPQLDDFTVRVRCVLASRRQLHGFVQDHWQPLSTQLTQTAYAYGSGVLFAYGEHVGVLTSAHLVSGAISSPVIIHKGTEYQTTVLYINVVEDIAILEPDTSIPVRGPLPRLSATPPRLGSELYLAGFDGNQRPRSWTAKVLNIVKARSDLQYGNWFVVSGVARQGDSGGPAFTLTSESDIIIYGSLWGTNGTTTVFTWHGAINKKLSELCWRGRQVQPSAPNPSQPYSPPTTRPPLAEAPSPAQPPKSQQPAQPSQPETSSKPFAEGLAWFLIGFCYTLAAAPILFVVLAALSSRKR